MPHKEHAEWQQQPGKDQPRVDQPQEIIPSTPLLLLSARGSGDPRSKRRGRDRAEQTNPLPTAGGDPKGPESTLNWQGEAELLSSKSPDFKS